MPTVRFTDNIQRHVDCPTRKARHAESRAFRCQAASIVRQRGGPRLRMDDGIHVGQRERRRLVADRVAQSAADPFRAVRPG
jgi:hypothetical protein